MGGTSEGGEEGSAAGRAETLAHPVSHTLETWPVVSERGREEKKKSETVPPVRLS